MAQSLEAAWAELLADIFPPDRLQREHRVDLALTVEGGVRASRLIEVVPTRAMPSVPPSQIDPPEGVDADDLEDYLASLDLAFLPVASPAFTGTLSGPDGHFTDDLTVDGDSTLGNADADVLIVQGHDRHMSTAPGIAVGVALGTGGSVGVTIAGTDQVGVIALVSGTTSLTTGVMATITYATARPNSDYAITVTPRGQSAGVNAVQFYIVRDSASAWSIRCNVAPGSGVTLEYHYHIREYQN